MEVTLHLPFDVLAEIAQYLDISDFSSFSRVCKWWSAATRDRSFVTHFALRFDVPADPSTPVEVIQGQIRRHVMLRRRVREREYEKPDILCLGKGLTMNLSHDLGCGVVASFQAVTSPDPLAVTHGVSFFEYDRPTLESSSFVPAGSDAHLHLNVLTCLFSADCVFLLEQYAQQPFHELVFRSGRCVPISFLPILYIEARACGPAGALLWCSDAMTGAVILYFVQPPFEHEHCWRQIPLASPPTVAFWEHRKGLMAVAADCVILFDYSVPGSPVIICIDTDTLQERWRRSLQRRRLITQLALKLTGPADGHEAAFCLSNHEMHVISLQSGELLWSTELQERPISLIHFNGLWVAQLQTDEVISFEDDESRRHVWSWSTYRREVGGRLLDASDTALLVQHKQDLRCVRFEPRLD